MNITAAIITSVVSCVVSFFFGGALTIMSTKWKKAIKREKALQEGMQSLLRDKLIEFHDKYTERGYCPIYVKESVQKSYESYHELGGNGVITTLYNELMRLPEKKKEE